MILNGRIYQKRIQSYCKNRGIGEPQKMTTKELLNTLTRCDSRCKVKNNCKKLSKIGLENIT